MFGFLFGTVCLVALVKVVRRGGGWGHHAGGRRRWAMRYVFQKLGTTPGQERVIEDVANDLENKGRAMREALRTARADFANAMRAEGFDSTRAREAMDRQQTLIDELKAAALAGMQKIHEALDPEQRKRVGDLLEFGPSRFGGGCGGGWGHGRHGGYSGRGGPEGRYASGGAVNL